MARKGRSKRKTTKRRTVRRRTVSRAVSGPRPPEPRYTKKPLAREFQQRERDRQQAIRSSVVRSRSRYSKTNGTARLTSAQGDSPRRVPPSQPPKKTASIASKAPHSVSYSSITNRARCKQRPVSNRSKGGGSRAFVPWCR